MDIVKPVLLGQKSFQQNNFQVLAVTNIYYALTVSHFTINLPDHIIFIVSLSYNTYRVFQKDVYTLCMIIKLVFINKQFICKT